MLPHQFRKQIAGRKVSSSIMNQTLDTVRRLAISQPPPGMSGIATSGGLLNFLSSPVFLIAFADESGVPGRGSSSNFVMGNGLAYPVGISTDENGVSTLSVGTDVTTKVPICNPARMSVHPSDFVICIKLWDLWVVIWEECPDTDND